MKKPTLVGIVAAIALAAFCNGQQIINATGAGRWYPADPAELGAQVDAFLQEKPDSAPDGRPIAIIAPDARLQ